MSKGRILILNILLVTASVIAPCLGLEFLFRAVRIAYNKPPYYQSDPELGWTPVPNINVKNMPVIDQDGTTYRVNFSTNPLGLRYSESDWLVQPVRGSSKILVLGDSFTGDAYTSDSEAWFAFLNADLRAPVYAFGIGGSGTYQQFLVLEKLLPQVNPDIIILQACTNDIDNNDPAQIFTGIRNQEMRRPFLSHDGYPFYAEGLYPSLYRLLFANSQLFAYIDNQLAKRGVSLPFENNRTQVRAQLTLNFHGGDAKGITQAALNMFAQKAKKHNPNVLLYAVLCASDEKNLWPRLLTNSGFTYLSAPLQAVESAEESGVKVRINDGAHWNRQGNAIFGRELSKILSNLMAQ